MSSDDRADPALARLLEDPAVWAEVPAGLRERTLTEATAAHDGAMVTRSDVEPALRTSGSTRRVGHRRVVLAAAAVVVLGLMLAGGLLSVGDPRAGGVEVALTGTDDGPGAAATAELRNEPAGVSVELEAGALPPAPEGSFYEVWLVGSSGKVSAGSFHRRGHQDRITLWLGVDPDDYDAITVTRQPVAGGTPADGVVVLRGELPDHM